jgi:hypothetical protein
LFLSASRRIKITKSLSHTCPEHCRRIIKVFEDFKLAQELREEIAKVKPCLALASLNKPT